MVRSPAAKAPSRLRLESIWLTDIISLFGERPWQAGIRERSHELAQVMFEVGDVADGDDLDGHRRIVADVARRRETGFGKVGKKMRDERSESVV